MAGTGAGNHLVSESERDCRDIQSGAGGKQTREHENRGSSILGRDTESRGEVFVDRVNFVVVVRLDENVTDEDTREDRAERELDVGVVAQRKAFAGRAEKCARACFGGDDRSEHGPPGNAPSAECEVGKIFLFSAHVEADRNDEDKIKKQNPAIDGEPSVHVDLR